MLQENIKLGGLIKIQKKFAALVKCGLFGNMRLKGVQFNRLY